MPRTASGIVYDHSEPTDQPADTPRAGIRTDGHIVFVHAGAADRRMWNQPWARLAARHRLTRLDLRGFGDSTTAPSSGTYAHAADVWEVIDAVGSETVHLVGSSFGSGVAVEAALTAPDRIASLVICPPGGSLLAIATDALRAFFAAERVALQADDLDAAVEANLVTWLAGPQRSVTDLDPELVQQVRTMQRRAFAAAEELGSAEEVELDPPALDRLAEIAVPTLLLLGGLDLDAVADSADRLQAGMGDLTRVEWPDVGHLPSLEQPERFTELLVAWVADRAG